MKIYRGISTKYATAPFIPSGCRNPQIEMMKREIDGYVYINYKSLEDSIKTTFKKSTNKIFPFYVNSDPLSFFNYFLTLLFMNLKLRRNEIIEDYFSFQLELLPALNGLTKINRSELAKFCWEEIYIPLLLENFKHRNRFQQTLAVSSYFQHLNHIFDNRTPTLGLDWTEDINIAKMFGDQLISINIDRYGALVGNKSWGCTSYRDKINNNNKLINEQKGYIIFWPWNYTIQELQENSFGQFLEFNIET